MERTKSSMKTRLEEIIETGRRSASGVLTRIMTEMPIDRIVRARALDFEADERGIFVKVPGAADGPGGEGEPSSVTERLHPNAFGQMMERADIPMEYARTLQKMSESRPTSMGAVRSPWGNQLLAHNLKEIYSHQADTRYLTRSVPVRGSGAVAPHDEMRGFLSNKFRRLDSRPIIEALNTASDEIGAFPIDGFMSDTRCAITIILPKVFEIAKGEFVAWGFSWQNSDYGDGAHNLLEFLYRIICMNGATGKETLRQVHLGGRLDESDMWSARTQRLDSERSASMVKDAIKGYLSPRVLEEKAAFIKKAADETVDLDARGMKEFLKKQLGAGDAKKAVEKFNSADVEMLPPGNSLWRLSNAISWMAGQEKDADKRMALMATAGAVLDKAA
jgi:hypothetical protein